jgi:hypothetical protein
MTIVLVLTFVPVLDTFLALGNAWQGIPPTFLDEPLYFAHMHAIGEGYLNDGNPYFFEHRYDPPLVIFGGAWLNALPLFAGVPFNVTLMINFVIWSLAFAVLLYWLFRELLVSQWIAVFGTVLLYMQSYVRVWRPANLQTVYPFYFLFYIALIRLVREQSRRNIFLLATATGISFYLYAYLWQIAVITLGLLFLYALVRKNRPLMKATFLSSLIGGIIGLPILLYTFWLSHSSPYFWESLGRLGLVNTHLPMAEVIYSGGLVGITLIFLAILYWSTQAFREDREFLLLCLFFCLSGFGLWIMEGSNLITGKLFEIGEHIRILILLWLGFASVILGSFLWKRRTELTRGVRALSFIIVMIGVGTTLYYTYYYNFGPLIKIETNREFWLTEQSYAKPFAWLDNAEKGPVVVWSNPHDTFSGLLPIFTKHFTVFVTAGMWHLVPEGEIRERYLVSQYFNNPTADDLHSDRGTYLGRQDLFHNAKTIERGVKICRILYFWDVRKDCGAISTSEDLLGKDFFVNLEQQFTNDIKPNIRTYLKKYHVSYIVKNMKLESQMRPETLGATLVYSDGLFEIYRLP